MTKLQDDRSAVKQSMRRAMMTSAFFLAPLMVMLAATAKQLVLILFTEKWLGAVPFMQVISLGYIFAVMGSANLQAINAIGRSDITFKLEFIKKPFYLAIILGTMLISPLAIAAGNAVYSVISSAVNAIPNKRLIDYRYGEQLLDILPQLLLALIAGGAAFAIGQLPWNIYLVLLLQLAVGTMLYLGLARLFRMESLRYVIETIRDYRDSKRNLPVAVQEG
jgi:O-antigen/teichoic acid export membrane protein